MVAQNETSPEQSSRRTLWGLEPVELHDRFWAARGVQVVRPGEPAAVAGEAPLFLLVEPQTLALFSVAPLVRRLSWSRPRVVIVRLHAKDDEAYRERIEADDEGRFLGIQRAYDERRTRVVRVAVTPHREVALWWQGCGNARHGWRRLRHVIERHERPTTSISGQWYQRGSPAQEAHFTRGLAGAWAKPGVMIESVRELDDGVWADGAARHRGSPRVGPVWIGVGRHTEDTASIVGPAVLWDESRTERMSDSVDWGRMAPHRVLRRPPRPRRLQPRQRAGKRLFDIAFSVGALAVTLPLYPLIMLAIWLEDGGPMFFSHPRETLSGRTFPCFKFRSMRRDAERIKARYAGENIADGPQFFIERDPRLTRVGRLLRNTNIDEWPQFLNVLLGHMSIVGPRPSPRSENQYCPAWREARLSVRPGITGLWQVCRSRAPGLDFQEWIRYDIAYVERISFRLDLWILKQTLRQMFRLGRGGSRG